MKKLMSAMIVLASTCISTLANDGVITWLTDDGVITWIYGSSAVSAFTGVITW